MTRAVKFAAALLFGMLLLTAFAAGAHAQGMCRPNSEYAYDIAYGRDRGVSEAATLAWMRQEEADIRRALRRGDEGAQARMTFMAAVWAQMVRDIYARPALSPPEAARIVYRSQCLWPGRDGVRPMMPPPGVFVP